jgi:hypothetical protein
VGCLESIAWWRPHPLAWRHQEGCACVSVPVCACVCSCGCLSAFQASRKVFLWGAFHLVSVCSCMRVEATQPLPAPSGRAASGLVSQCLLCLHAAVVGAGHTMCTYGACVSHTDTQWTSSTPRCLQGLCRVTVCVVCTCLCVSSLWLGRSCVGAALLATCSRTHGLLCAASAADNMLGWLCLGQSTAALDLHHDDACTCCCCPADSARGCCSVWCI